jgi:putative acetyltransferase
MSFPLPSGPAIRPATNADGDAVGRLMAGVFTEYPGCVYVASEYPELVAVADHFAASGGVMWVVEASGGLIGSLAIAESSEPGVMELHKVYLTSRHRGRGVAGRLLELAEDFARLRGAYALQLWTDTRFVQGHRFYERQGFVRMPGVRALHDASASLEYPYRKDLGESAVP